METLFNIVYPFALSFFSNEKINKNNYKLGNTAFINDPSDIRTMSCDENVTRLISKCPFASNNVHVYLHESVNELFLGLHGIHATLVSNDNLDSVTNNKLGQCFQNKMTDAEIKQIQTGIDNNHDITELLLRIFLKRIYPKRKRIISKLIALRENDDQLKLQIRKSNPPVPEYEVYTTIRLIKQPVLFINYITKLYNEKINYIDYPIVSTNIRFATVDMKVGYITINKGDTIIFNTSCAVTKTKDKRFFFGCGTDFRKCQLADFLDDFFTRIAKTT